MLLYHRYQSLLIVLLLMSSIQKVEAQKKSVKPVTSVIHQNNMPEKKEQKAQSMYMKVGAYAGIPLLLGLLCYLVAKKIKVNKIKENLDQSQAKEIPPPESNKLITTVNHVKKNRIKKIRKSSKSNKKGFHSEANMPNQYKKTDQTLVVLPQEPTDKKKRKFNEQPVKPLSLVGLPRIGYSCYLNTTIQVLWIMIYSLGEEALEMVRSWSNFAPQSPEEKLVIAFSQLMKAIEESESTPDNNKVLDSQYLENLKKKLDDLPEKYSTIQDQGDVIFFTSYLLANINKGLLKQNPQNVSEYSAEQVSYIIKEDNFMESYFYPNISWKSVKEFKEKFLDHKKLVEQHQISPFARFYYTYPVETYFYFFDTEKDGKLYLFKQRDYLFCNLEKKNVVNDITDMFKVTFYNMANNRQLQKVKDAHSKNKNENKTNVNKDQIPLVKVFTIAPPPILFLFTGENERYTSTNASYPLHGLVVAETIYDLIAVMMHIVYSKELGHYVSMIKDIYTNQWYEIDDTLIYKVDPSYVADHTKQKDKHKRETKARAFVYLKRNFRKSNMQDTLEKHLIRQSLRRLEYRNNKTWVSSHQEMHQLWDEWNQKSALNEKSKELLPVTKEKLLSILKGNLPEIQGHFKKLIKEDQDIQIILSSIQEIFQKRKYLEKDDLVKQIYGFLDLIDYALYQNGKISDTL